MAKFFLQRQCCIMERTQILSLDNMNLIPKDEIYQLHDL